MYNDEESSLTPPSFDKDFPLQQRMNMTNKWLTIQETVVEQRDDTRRHHYNMLEAVCWTIGLIIVVTTLVISVFLGSAWYNYCAYKPQLPWMPSSQSQKDTPSGTPKAVQSELTPESLDD